jgi:ABC-2 type transport system permease protein
MNWTAQFLHGYSYGQLFYLFVAMIAGAGAIANDNRSNALLVYLSKPCTKKDYVIGKWVGVFVPVAFAMLVPAAFFYVYGAMNYRNWGFISDDPWIPLRMLAIIAFGASLHASLVLGVSSLFNQGRMATAAYMGLYFISNIVTVFIKVILMEAQGGSSAMRNFTEGLFYCSIDGLNIGIAKVFLDIDGGSIFGQRDIFIDRPTPLLVIFAVVAVSLLSLRLVWRRVRAVEVVG